MSPKLLAALAAAAVLLLGLEALRRFLRVPAEVTRASYFIAVAAGALAALYFFEDAAAAARPFLVLSVVMYVSFRFEMFHAVEDDGTSLGSVLLPLSCAILLAWFGNERAHLAVAGIFAAGFGDTFATLVGRRLGTRKYRSLGHSRSMEGTLTLFLVSGMAMALVLMRVGGLDVHQALAFSLIGATVAASVESVAVYGTDNLTVPLATAGTLAMLMRFSQ